ncbi:MAG: S1C family serine protease, partial [Desulfovibrionaceae bacterium]
VFDMDVVKLATVNYYVVDRRSMRYFKDTFDARQKQAFSIPYGLQHRDPHQHEIMANRDAEEEVLHFEEDPITVPLSAILDQFVSQPEKGQKLASLSSLADQIFEERNRAVAAAKKAKVFTADVSRDDRFESVAYIELPQSLGSGFYVRDDIVMTNYHVVEESDFVEIRLYDGSETFGRVIAKDIHRDLALVKVQARRKPLAFYHANTVPVGATVEVIGNPHGFKFSLSRGVISAVREHHSIMGPKSKNVLFIQIDAAISPGNSGGPVFLGDSVVSVVDWGDSEDRAQNLNFTIHYSEVLEFMRKNDIEPILASEEDIHAKN